MIEEMTIRYYHAFLVSQLVIIFLLYIHFHIRYWIASVHNRSESKRTVPSLGWIFVVGMSVALLISGW